MRTTRMLTVLVFALLAPALAAAQHHDKAVFWENAGTKVALIEAAPMQAVPAVANAPFTADAVTEFTQILGDGNRIERRYTSSIARDRRGRTRREEEIVFLGALSTAGSAPPLVTIEDPEAGIAYTLDDRLRVAHRNGWTAKAAENWTTAPSTKELDGGAADAVTESLGRRTIEGVTAEGTRTTSTIPAGTIGNFQAIEIVSERWFSPELQMPVLITRRDPRNGDTVYRLVNIVRAEPPAHLFLVPPGYEVREGKLGTWKMIETAKAKKATAARGKTSVQRKTK